MQKLANDLRKVAEDLRAVGSPQPKSSPPETPAYQTIVDNPSVQGLVQRHGGKIVPYKDLPPAYKNALDTYHLESDDPSYKRQQFGMAAIPTEELVQAVWENNEWVNEDHASPEAYQQSLMGNSGTDHGNSVWPVVVGSHEDGVLQDGWHRFQSYVMKGLKMIPVVWYPKMPSTRS